MTISCTIEARIGSTRLPGKAMYCLDGRPILAHVVEAAKASLITEEVILCTTERPVDDILSELGIKLGITVFRGSENDIPNRIACGIPKDSEINVFLTGDNPFVTSDLIAQGVEQFCLSGADYLCSTHMKYSNWWSDRPTLPTGLSIQVARTSFFRWAEARTAADDSVRQHSTMVMYREAAPGRRYVAYKPPPTVADVIDFSRRYTVDTAEDYLWAVRLTSAGMPRTLDELAKRSRVTI